MKETGTFGIVDYIILGGTLLISILIGLYYAFIKKQRTNAELLLGSQSMSIFPVSLFLLATYMSAILVLGFTGEIYQNGTLIAEMLVGCFFYIPLGGVIFLPTLYSLRLTSVYEYLQKRFNSSAVRLIATATFMIQVLMYMGVVLLAPGLALNAILDFPVDYAMLLIGTCAAIYTSIGGYRAVVWTDCFQIIMMLAGMSAVIIQGSIQVGGLGRAFKIADDHGRINFLNFNLNPFVRHTSWGLFFGQGIGWLSALIFTGPLVAMTMSFACLCGIVIFANYAGCDPLSLGKIARGDQIAPYFVLQYLSPVAGLLGLFLSCLFSGSLSTLSSGINSVSAVLVEDFLKRIPNYNKISDVGQGIITKLSGLLIGALVIGSAFLAKNLDGVLSATIVVNGSVTGPLLGIFILGILIPCANKYGAITGMLLGHTLTLWVSIGSLVNLKKVTRTLPLSTEECEADVWENYNMTEALEKQRLWTQPPVVYDWPMKIFSVSYLYYPLIGCSITVVVGVLVSLCTGPKGIKGQEAYLHPLIVMMHRKLQNSGTRSSTGRHLSRYEVDPSLNMALNTFSKGPTGLDTSNNNYSGGHRSKDIREANKHSSGNNQQCYYDNRSYER